MPETEEDLARVVRHRFPQHPGLAARMVQALEMPTTEPAPRRWLYDAVLADPELYSEVDVAGLARLLGAESGERAAALVAAQRQWAQRYRAELVAHGGPTRSRRTSRPACTATSAARCRCTGTSSRSPAATRGSCTNIRSCADSTFGP